MVLALVRKTEQGGDEKTAMRGACKIVVDALTDMALSGGDA
jgi:hypothetical protein